MKQQVRFKGRESHGEAVQINFCLSMSLHIHGRATAFNRLSHARDGAKLCLRACEGHFGEKGYGGRGGWGQAGETKEELLR